MNCSTRSAPTTDEGVREPLAGGSVPDVFHTGTGDLSDWVELMEAVEALCPTWPQAERSSGQDFRL